MLESLTENSAFGFIIIKVNTELFEKKNRMYVFIHTMFKFATKLLAYILRLRLDFLSSK